MALSSCLVGIQGLCMSCTSMVHSGCHTIQSLKTHTLQTIWITVGLLRMAQSGTAHVLLICLLRLSAQGLCHKQCSFGVVALL